MIEGQPWCGLDPVKDPEGDGVVSDVGEGPDPRDGEDVDRDGQEDQVSSGQDEDVEQPEAAAVHVVRVRVLVPVTSGHHHGHHKIKVSLFVEKI